MEKDTVLKIKNVSVVFDGFQALTDVNVKVKRNSIHFFIGPNGAGKTTLLDIICAKTKPTGGNVSFYPMHGEKVRLTGMKEYKIVKEGVVRKFQVPSVFVKVRLICRQIWWQMKMRLLPIWWYGGGQLQSAMVMKSKRVMY